MPVFRKPKAPESPLIVSVTGVRLGMQVAGIVGQDARLFFEIARRVGLTGRATALAQDEQAATAIGDAAIADGVTLDVASPYLPLTVPDGSLDLVIVDERSPRPASYELAVLLPHVRTALRQGGRALVVLPAGGLFARWLGTTRPPDVRPVLDAFLAAGLSKGRLLAAYEGLAFVEALRPGEPS
jgi:hypothetical protein